MQGWRKRMEDAHITDISQGKSSELDVFGVFDGHGGKEISQFVTNHFTKELIINKNYINGDLKTGIKETFIKMDEIMQTNEGKEEIKKYARKSKEEDDLQNKNEPPNSQMAIISQLIGQKDPESDDIAMRTGCTGCVCVIDEGNKKMYFANAGDSRVVLCKNGNAIPMSTDHKPELEEEKDRIYKADGWITDGRVKGNLNLTRGLGDLDYKQNKNLKPEEQIITSNPDILIEDFSNDVDFIIIGCDGIWDCLTNQQACDFVKNRLNNKGKLSKIIEEMMDSICAKDLYNATGLGCDNMTCMIIIPKK
jgi:serine/threonine protein phosphatase PrpC